MSYLILAVWLIFLGVGYLRLADYRLLFALAIGLSYLFWGIIRHWRSKTMYWPVVLEYFALSLLAVTILIFISLRT